MASSPRKRRQPQPPAADAEHSKHDDGETAAGFATPPAKTRTAQPSEAVHAVRRAGLRVTRRLAEAEAEGRMESEAASAEGATGDQSADAQVQPKLRPQRAQPLAFESPVQHTHALPRRSLEAIGRAEQLTKRADELLAKHRKPTPTVPAPAPAAMPVASAAAVAVLPLAEIPDSDPPRELNLPASYQLLLKFAEQLDLAISALGKRGIVTYANTSAFIQRQTRRTFSREHLAQIVAVAPDAYVLRPTLVKDSQLGEGRYELVILARRAQKSADGAVVEAEDPASARKIILTTPEIVGRTNQFHWRLIHRVSQHHAAYLAALPGKPSVRWQTLKRWHAAFDVEATPAVVPAVLPKDGPTQIATIDSLLARGVPSSLSASATAAVRHVHDVRAALNPEKASSEPGRSATGAALPLPVPVPRAVPTETSTAVPDSLKGLLSGEAAARIVARQKQRTEAMLRVDSVDLSRASRLEGLMPLLNILWGATKAQNKKSMKKLELVRLASNRAGSSTAETESSIKLLLQALGADIQEKSIEGQTFIKIESQRSLTDLKATLVTMANEAREAGLGIMAEAQQPPQQG